MLVAYLYWRFSLTRVETRERREQTLCEAVSVRPGSDRSCRSL